MWRSSLNPNLNKRICMLWTLWNLLLLNQMHSHPHKKLLFHLYCHMLIIILVNQHKIIWRELIIRQSFILHQLQIFLQELVSIHLNLLDFLLFLPANQESRFNLINNSINLQFLKTSIFQTQIRIFLNLFTGLRIIQGLVKEVKKAKIHSTDNGKQSCY